NQGQNVNLGINDMGANALGDEGAVSKAAETGIDGVTVRSGTGAEATVTFEVSKADDNAVVTSTTAKVDEDGNITVTLAQAAGSGESGGAGDVTATNADVLKALQSAGLIVEIDTDKYDADVAASTFNLT